MSSGAVHVIRNDISTSYAGIVRDRDSDPGRIREALECLGTECAREIVQRFQLTPLSILTPFGETVQTLGPKTGLAAVVTTKADFQAFGTSIARSLKTSLVGYMDFGSARGKEALTAPVREIHLPHADHVETLVIAKSVMATGCTAISLAQLAIDTYRPNRVVIASVFYSVEGVHEVTSEFPEAELVVFDDPDELDSDGMLHPGVGILEQRAYSKFIYE